SRRRHTRFSRDWSSDVCSSDLALLAGLLMLGLAGDSFDLPLLVARRDLIAGHPLYPAIVLLVAAGAFTKSAQMPLHFWLPGAMEIGRAPCRERAAVRRRAEVRS